MRLTRIAVICAIALAATATPASALSPKARIGFSGLGPLTIGMTERQIERAGKRPIKLGFYHPGADCALATLAGKTDGLFTDRRLRRIYIRTPVFATTEGVRVGSTEERVLAAYPGRLTRQPQKYIPDEDDLVMRKGDRKVVFTLAKGKVSQISTGRKPEIDFVEGCA